MATKIFPSTNDVNGGVAGQGKTLTEANLKTLQAMPYFDRPYVKSGAVCTNGGGLLLTVATGHYCIDGRWIYKDASENVTLTASSTNRVWLQLTKDGSGNVTGTTWNVQTGTTVPSDAVLVAEVVTGASTITTIKESFRGVIAPGRLIKAGTAITANTGGVASSTTPYTPAMAAVNDVMGDGLTTVRVELAGSHHTHNQSDGSLGISIHRTSPSAANKIQDTAEKIFGSNQVHNVGILNGYEPAYVGARSFVSAGSFSGTSGNYVIGAGATYPHQLRAYWDF